MPSPTDDKIIETSTYHYQQGEVECIEAMRSALGTEGFRGFCSGNVIKYVWRHRHKGTPAADLDKALQYLNWLRDDIA